MRPPLGAEAIALGSWNTWSRISFEEGLEIVDQAIQSGVRVFDVAYYWDGPYTDVLFGQYLRALAVPRESIEISEKLWLWNYPEETLAEQVKRALVRLGVDRIDTAVLSRPAGVGQTMEQFLTAVRDLLDTGTVDGWSICNWDLDSAHEAVALAGDFGVPHPREMQLQYSVARRNVVESPGMDAFFAETGIALQPAFTLEGGILAGKLDRDRVDPEVMAAGGVVSGRNIARDSGGIRQRIRDLAPQLRAIAERFGVSTAQLALAFALLHPYRSTVLVGMSTVEQLHEALGAVDLARSHGNEVQEALLDYHVGDTAVPALFNPRLDRRIG